VRCRDGTTQRSTGSYLTKEQRDMTREGLSPQTIATYLSLLGTVCKAAVDDGYLDRAPGRHRHPASLTATAAEPSLPRMVWLTAHGSTSSPMPSTPLTRP